MSWFIFINFLNVKIIRKSKHYLSYAHWGVHFVEIADRQTFYRDVWIDCNQLDKQFIVDCVNSFSKTYYFLMQLDWIKIYIKMTFRKKKLFDYILLCRLSRMKSKNINICNKFCFFYKYSLYNFSLQLIDSNQRYTFLFGGPLSQ